MLQSDAPITRMTTSSGISRLRPGGPSLLIRIYPVDGIEAPIELSTTPLTVGRCDSCSLPIRDDSVSRRHATLDPDAAGGHIVRDLGSTNGTYVNEERVVQPRTLRAGDRIRFGNQIFKYLGPDRLEANYHEVIYKTMTTDGLTGAHTRRYLVEALERELQHAHRAGTPVAVLMLDLDRFKSINDTHGHLAGDAVLVEFARRIGETLRSGDLFARYGGEEFAVLLARTDLDDAVLAAERIREVTAANPVLFEGINIPITVSIGVATATAFANETPDQLLGHADERLYQAKRSGRNRVEA
jgi:diguanylate cyclase (GGDEF)-like protein